MPSSCQNFPFLPSSSALFPTLLEKPGATTAHSLFKVPVQEEDDDTVLESNVKSESARGVLLRAARLLTWDEMPAAHIAVFEAVMRLLRRLHSADGANDIAAGNREATARISNTSVNGQHTESPDSDDVYAEAVEQFANEPAAEDVYWMEEELDQNDCYFMAVAAHNNADVTHAGTLPFLKSLSFLNRHKTINHFWSKSDLKLAVEFPP